MDYPSCINNFETNCHEKIVDTSAQEIVQTNKFIKLVTRIGKNYPFVFLPSFIEDFMNGEFTKKILKKYRLDSMDYVYIVKSILKLDGTRSKNPNKDNKNINMQNPEWKKLYMWITTQSHIFDTALVNLLHCNILCALVGHVVLNSEYISHDDLEKSVLDLYHKSDTEILVLHNRTMYDSFENYICDGLGRKLDDVVGYLAQESYITSMDGDVAIPSKYSKLPDNVYNIINEKKDGISYGSLRKKIMIEFPLFKTSFDIEGFDKVIKDLEQDQTVIRKYSFWKDAPNSDQLFSQKNYDAKIEQVNTEIEQANTEIISRGRTKFFGRSITPDQFISELKTLDLGDLDDLDDQVTRIAGLVLSDAIQLQSPREFVHEFDFMVDLTNYNFRPEQEEMMRKLDFQANSNIFHCKVMINDKVTTDIISKIKDVIPDGEQGVIFTCMPVSPTIREQTKSDRAVQIIDEDAIRDWCTITPTIPCRQHSIAKVMYGDIRRKIVHVKSLNYESGLATVEIIPSHTEHMLSIGCLQEISPNVHDPVDFDTASEKYFDFLYRLADSSPVYFDDGMNTPIVTVHNTYTDLLANTNPELFDNNHPKFDVPTKQESVKYVEFANKIHVEIDLESKSSFKCACGHRLNEEYNYTLCKHLVSTINHLCQGELSEWDMVRSRIDKVTQKLVDFEKDNLKRIILSIQSMLEPESSFLIKQYVDAYVNCYHS